VNFQVRVSIGPQGLSIRRLSPENGNEGPLNALIEDTTRHTICQYMKRFESLM
jgi:hypothetical protein